jgi:hypothetical protein
MRLLSSLLVLGLVACDGAAETSDGEPIGGQGGGGTSSSSSAAGSGGADGGGGQGGEGGAPNPRAEDYAALEACSVPTCADAHASRQDVSVLPITFFGFECVLEAMVARTPGTYRIQLTHTWGNGAATYDQVLVVTPLGDALYATETGYNGTGAPEQPFTPVQRCDLKPVAFFEECLANYADGSPGNPPWVDCIYPDDMVIQETVPLPWFENCEEVEPVCE